MVDVKEYTLCIIPSEEVYERLYKIISDLSKKYNAPLFEPHITLLGNIVGTEEEMLSKSSELANVLRPFKIRLTTVDCLDQYFRCVFIRAEETKPLTEANEKAREMFNWQGDPKFMPHMSLLYGKYPKETKEQIIAEIGKDFNIEFDVNSIHLVYSSSNIPIKDWCRIKELPLGSQ